MSRSPRVAIVQLTATSDKDANFFVCKACVEEAAARGASLVAFPESFAFVGDSPSHTVYEGASSLTSPQFTRYRALAARHGVWLSLGGFHVRVPPAGARFAPNSRLARDRKSGFPTPARSATRTIVTACAMHMSSWTPLGASRACTTRWLACTRAPTSHRVTRTRAVPGPPLRRQSRIPTYFRKRVYRRWLKANTPGRTARGARRSGHVLRPALPRHV